jgi:hypothetical protein
LAAKGALDVKAVCAPQITTLLPPEHRFGKGCLAGKSYCVVTPSGEVRPCAYLDQVAGNVLDTPFEDLWRNAPLFRAMRNSGVPWRLRRLFVERTLRRVPRPGVCRIGKCPGKRPALLDAVMTPDELEDRLLSRLQGDGLPLSPVPYADLAEELEVSEERCCRRWSGSSDLVWCVSSAACRCVGARHAGSALCSRRAGGARRGRRGARRRPSRGDARLPARGRLCALVHSDAGSSGELDRIITEIEAETACTVALRLPSQEVWKLRTDFRLPGSRS